MWRADLRWLPPFASPLSTGARRRSGDPAPAPTTQAPQETPSCRHQEGGMNRHHIQRIVQALERQGWRLARITGAQHFLFAGPSGAQLTLNLHGSHAIDRYQRRHLRRDLRRMAA
jgi:predicted RNA binding protein YcfA (HicA-like mRNA interferase family)